MRCLGFDWSVRSHDADLVARVTDLYAACRGPGPPQHRFTLTVRPEAPRPRVDVARNGSVVRTAASVDVAVAHLAWEINRGVVEATSDRLLLHAAAAARDGAAVLLPGAQGAGKSTLVTALVRAGLAYLTDEVVAVDPERLTLDPYPKPVALDAGAAALLPGIAGDAAGGAASDQWLVGPHRIRPASIAPAACEARLVVLVEYLPGKDTALEPITRAEAAVALARHSFNFRTFDATRLDVLAGLLADCACYRLDVGPLENATRADATRCPPCPSPSRGTSRSIHPGNLSSHVPGWHLAQRAASRPCSVANSRATRAQVTRCVDTSSHPDRACWSGWGPSSRSGAPPTPTCR